MWECRNCREKIEDRFKHCWNCGAPRTAAEPPASTVEAGLQEPPAVNASPESPPSIPPKTEIPPEKTPPATAPPAETRQSIPPADHVPFESAAAYREKSTSKIGSLVPLILWLAAAVNVALFAYYSNRKTQDFENRLREDAAALGSQSRQFVFSKNAPREKKGTIEAKVLPLNAANSELDGLYYNLPDDLRPATLDEVKTILWLDCKPSEAGAYEDGTPAFRDKCNAYLVDRTSSKVIQVQDFSGELPPLKKGWGTNYASGKVLPETYIAYIKANQPETMRTPFARASDSPEHHIWFKSELLYVTALLVLLAAAAVGWVIYRIKSAWRPE